MPDTDEAWRNRLKDLIEKIIALIQDQPYARTRAVPLGEALVAVAQGGPATRRQVITCLAHYLDHAEVAELAEDAIRVALGNGNDDHGLIAELLSARSAGLSVSVDLTVVDDQDGRPEIELYLVAERLLPASDEEPFLYRGPLVPAAITALREHHPALPPATANAWPAPRDIWS